MESKESSFFYIFRAPIEKVYNIFVSPTLLTCTFFQNAKILNMKREESNLDSSGNEVTVLWNNTHQFTFRIDNTINLSYFKMFTHRSIANPSNFAPFVHTFSFFWNSTDKVTVFKFTAWVKDSKEKESITDYIMENKDSMCFSTENYLMTTLTNLEENESISKRDTNFTTIQRKPNQKKKNISTSTEQKLDEIQRTINKTVYLQTTSNLHEKRAIKPYEYYDRTVRRMNYQTQSSFAKIREPKYSIPQKEDKEENEKIENTVGNIPLKGSNESFKIKVGKSSDKKSANKELNLSEEKKIEVKENLQDKFEEPKVSSNDTNLPLQQTKSKDELKVESSQQDQSSIKTLSDEIKKISQMQESILSSISKLTQTVNSNYTELDKRVSKLESSLLELIKSNSVNTNSLHGNIIDKEWQKILTEIEQGNYANAINLSVSNDEYLFKCISKLPTDKVKSIDTTAIEDILSRLIVLIPRGDNLDVMIPFCETIIKNKVQLKKITKQNLKDVISYISSHRNNFILSEETNKKIDSLTLYFSSD